MLRSINGDPGTGDMARPLSRMSLVTDGRAPSLSGTPRRSVNGSDKNELATIVAKLNTITSQNIAHDTLFEAQKMQAEEIQFQLNEQQNQLLDLQNQLREQQNQLSLLSLLQNQMSTLQEQQDRMMDLLENLKSNAVETANHVRLESLTSLSGLPTGISRQSAITRTEYTDDLTATLKRGRGRPREKCSKCKQKKPLQEGLPLCEDCYRAFANAKGRKRNLSQHGEPTGTRNALKNPRLDDSRVVESEIIDNVAQGFTEHNGTTIVSSSPKSRAKGNTTDVPVRTARLETSHQHQPEEAIIVVSKSSETPERPLMEGWTSGRQASLGRVGSRQTSLALYNGPFFEDPESLRTPYSDIFDPPTSEASGSDLSSHVTVISIAESVPIDEFMNSSMEEGEIQEQNNSQAEHSNQQTNNNLADQRKQKHNPPSPLQTVNTVEHEEATRVNSIFSTASAPKANTIAKPRKPMPNFEPDGNRHDSHHKIVQKIMGSSWRAVNRRF